MTGSVCTSRMPGRPPERGSVSWRPRYAAEVHEGISDKEYVAALQVLRKMVANIEGDGTPGKPF